MTERERFEEFMIGEGDTKEGLEYNWNGTGYNYPATDLAWAAWQAAREWISTAEGLPEKSGDPVIAYGYNEAGKLRRLRAAYVHKHTIEDENDDYCGPVDYCEENDMTYWPEGWYEWNEMEDTHWMVDFQILGWQPLPEAPENPGSWNAKIPKDGE